MRPPISQTLMASLILLVMTDTSLAKKGKESTLFKDVFVENVEAAKSHYWDEIDCKRRDLGTGMPTSILMLPGASRSFIDSTEYTATYVFPSKGAGQEKLHAFVQAQAELSTPKEYVYDASEGPEYIQIQHAETPDAFVSVSLSTEGELLYMRFSPPFELEIPYGNPCQKSARSRAKKPRR
jgi:hypothetical protein